MTGAEPAREGQGLHEIKALWEQAQWHQLAQIGLQDIADQDERAELALFLAAARFHFGDKFGTQAMARQAIDWGASHADVTAMLFAGVENSFGRLAMFLDREDAAEQHFQAAVAPACAGAEASKLVFVRHFHEMLNSGLLPDAARKLSSRAAQADLRTEASRNWTTILDSKIEEMQHELSLSLKRGQLRQNDTAAAPLAADDDVREFAKKHSVSQLGQDIWVLEQTGFKKGGFFVEFGATNGILLSNSYLLETAFGWEGICAEPNPRFFAQLRQNRRCIVAPDCIGAQTGTPVRFIAADVFGGFEEHAEVDMHADKRRAYQRMGEVLELTTISLHDFLVGHNAPKSIDYLSIDTEGSEYEILEAFPFDEWDIRYLTVEHNSTPAREKIHDLLSAHGYIRTEAQWDDWYARAPAQSE